MFALEIVEKSEQQDTEEFAKDANLDIEEVQVQVKFDVSELNKAVSKASEGALVTKTVSTYRRHAPF